MPLFSIVVPAYNSEKFINETLKSLLNQDFTDYEILIIDDGSSDDTFNILQKYKDKLKIYKQDHKGVAHARNLGIAEAVGKYVVSFDSDDLLLPHALKTYKRVIEYFNSPKMIIAKWIFSSELGDINSDFMNDPNIYCTKFECFFKKNVSISSGNSNLIVERKSLLEISGYPTDSISYDDYRLIFRLGDINPLVVITKPVTVFYRNRANSLSHKSDYQSEGIISLINDERLNLLAGGRRYEFDRRALIGGSALTDFKDFLNFRDFKYILKVLLHLRFMTILAILRKIKSKFYKGQKYIIN